MNRKAQISETLAAGIMLVITIFGVYSIIDETNELYYGDVESNSYYELSNCPDGMNALGEDKVVMFKSEKNAI